jgi:hypothetical protein
LIKKLEFLQALMPAAGLQFRDCLALLRGSLANCISSWRVVTGGKRAVAAREWNGCDCPCGSGVCPHLSNPAQSKTWRRIVAASWRSAAFVKKGVIWLSAESRLAGTKI